MPPVSAQMPASVVPGPEPVMAREAERGGLRGGEGRRAPGLSAHGHQASSRWRASTSAARSRGRDRPAPWRRAASALRARAVEWDRARSAPRRPATVRSRPFGITCRVPITASGTIGSPASIASRKLPPLKRPTRPSGLRVPSASDHQRQAFGDQRPPAAQEGRSDRAILRQSTNR